MIAYFYVPLGMTHTSRKFSFNPARSIDASIEIQSVERTDNIFTNKKSVVEEREREIELMMLNLVYGK